MRVRVGGAWLAFEVEGGKYGPLQDGGLERPTLVLLCADAAAGSFLGDAVPALAELAQIVTLDLPGHGRSDRSEPGRPSLDTWARDVEGFLEAVEIERPVLGGAGPGASVSLALAARRPELPRGLVLEAVAPLEAGPAPGPFRCPVLLLAGRGDDAAARRLPAELAQVVHLEDPGRALEAVRGALR